MTLFRNDPEDVTADEITEWSDDVLAWDPRNPATPRPPRSRLSLVETDSERGEGDDS